MSVDTDREYVAANEAFYQRFWRDTGGYDTARPNAEESARAGAILTFVGRIAEQAAGELRVLDVGCGRGWLTNLLAAYGPVTGCDLAGGGIERARELFPHVPFHHGALAALLQQQHVHHADVVVSSEVIEHVPGALKPAFVSDLRAALLPHGHCVVTTPRHEMFAVAGSSSSQLIEEWLTEAEMRRLFETAGFVCRGFTRVLGQGGTRVHRVIAWLERRIGVRAPAALHAWLDWRTALYQVWWFQRVD